MSQVTVAQKARLGLFVLSAMVLFLITFGFLIGAQLLQERDNYTIIFNESISGLEPGSPVKYNGVRVGSVEEFRIPRDNVTGVEVSVSLEKGTPVKTNTVAVLNLQGITGLKFIELTGGTNGQPMLDPGGVIQSSGSTMDLLQNKAASIAQKIEMLLDNLVVATGGEDGGKLPKILEEVDSILATANKILTDNDENIQETIGNLRDASAALTVTLEKTPALLDESQETVKTLRTLLNKEQVSNLLVRIEKVAMAAEARLSKKEMGKTLSSITGLAEESTELVKNADLTLLRARDDLLTAIDELLVGIEHFSEFAAILRDNPSALLGGGQKQERNLP